ncbi:MAG: hypothetical protein AB4368_05460 [Xenococcaceae cyanobacterium]
MKINPDYCQTLPTDKKNKLRPLAHDWIDYNLVESSQWQSCYSLKQAMTREIGYCYQADLYDFLRETGLKTKIDQRGYQYAKAGRRY